jgi:CheY-like chemotaxis protein
MNTSEFFLAALVQETCGSIAAPGGASLDLNCFVDPAIPERVVGDASQISELLREMILAAAENSSSRNLKLAVYPGRERPPELEITFEVSPVPASDRRENVRPELPRMDRAIIRAQTTARELGGDLDWSRQNGVAPVLWCRLPLQFAVHRAAARRVENNEARSSKHPIKILMAEDNSINQRVGTLILQRAGYKIDLVSDGNEAIEACRKSAYDLILMDCQMPTVDGFEATRQIRAIGGRQPVIIAVTANALVGERERCLAAGMDDYLSKPFQADQLVGIVEKWAAESLRRN